MPNTGGVPLLGVDGVVVISHGASNPRAIMNAIRVAGQAVENRISEHVLEGLKSNEAYYRKNETPSILGFLPEEKAG